MDATVRITATMAGLTASSTQTRTEDGVIGVNPTCPPAVEGSLTTRSSSSAGTITITAPTVESADKMVLTWVEGTTLKHRYNVVGVVTLVDAGSAGTADDEYEIAISGGAGDDLPVQDTAINVSEQVQANVTFDFDDVDTFCVSTNVRGVVAFMDGTDTQKLVMDMDTNGIGIWLRDSGFPEPMDGTSVTYVLAGSGSTSTTSFLPKILALYDATDPGGSGQ